MKTDVLIRKSLITATIGATLCLLGCGGNTNTNSTPIDQQPPVVVDTTNTMLKQAEGIWHWAGYGEVLQINDQAITTYEVNTVGCLQQQRLTPEDFLGRTEVLQTSDDGLSLQYERKGDTVHYRRYLSKIDALPAVCVDGVDNSDDPIVVFDYFWQSFTDHYTFSEGEDELWTALYQQYRPMITNSTTDQQLFEILSAMLEPLRDGHVILLDHNGGFFHTEKPNKLTQYINYQMARAATEDPEISEQALEQVAIGVLDKYIGSYLRYIDPQSYREFTETSDPDNLKWGRSPNNVGILTISSMSGYYAPGTELNSENEQAGALKGIKQVINDLGDTDALIIDVRQNGGGNDVVSLALASCFTDKPREVFYKEVNVKSGQQPKRITTLQPNDCYYGKPVYVLAGAGTKSAGETFVITMQALPDVTVVGEHTWGGLSDILNKALPNGWNMTLSNESLKPLDGTVVENIGIAPDLPLPVFSVQDLALERISIVDAVLELEDKQVSNTYNADQLNSDIAEIIENSGLVGVAIAIVDKDQGIVWQNNYGVANDQGQTITADTLFRSAAISQGILGNALRHAELEFGLDMSSPVSDYLTFEMAQDESINWLNLATHTSGITDANAQCAYYLQDGSSAALLLDPGANCPVQIPTQPSDFMAAYLTEDGSLFSQNNLIPTGTTHLYSRIGAGLTGVALNNWLSFHYDVSFEQYSQQRLFAPLGMNNSYYGKQNIPANTNIAQPFSYIGDSVIPQQLPDYQSAAVSGSELFSSTNDLAKWLSAELNSGLVDDELAINPLATVLSSTEETQEIHDNGTGVATFWSTDGFYYGTSGREPGVLTEMWIDTMREFGVVILATGSEVLPENQQALSLIKQQVWTLMQ